MSEQPHRRPRGCEIRLLSNGGGWCPRALIQDKMMGKLARPWRDTQPFSNESLVLNFSVNAPKRLCGHAQVTPFLIDGFSLLPPSQVSMNPRTMNPLTLSFCHSAPSSCSFSDPPPPSLSFLLPASSFVLPIFPSLTDPRIFLSLP